jgi:hypothetical protein
MAEGLARVLKLLAPIIAVGGARAFGSGVGAGVIILFAIVPDDLIV